MPHIIPFLTSQGSDPFTAIMVVIDSGKDKAERFHAATGVINYAGLLILDPAASEKKHNLAACSKKVGEYAMMSHADLCSAIKAATEDGTGQQLDATKIPWATIIQMVLAIVQQLITGA